MSTGPFNLEILDRSLGRPDEDSVGNKSALERVISVFFTETGTKLTPQI
jgi:hypothetical protein